MYFLNIIDDYDLIAFADNFPEDEDKKNDKKNKAVVIDTSGKSVEDDTKTDGEKAGSKKTDA